MVFWCFKNQGLAFHATPPAKTLAQKTPRSTNYL